MISTFALATALAFAPAQTSAGLNITNVRHTYRELGPNRPDKRYMQGDFVFIAFDIEGLKLSPDGRVQYSMGMELFDKAGKSIFSAPPTKNEMILALGGNKMPANVFVEIGPELQPGPYTCRVTVGDTATNATKVLDEKFDVIPKDFGMVGLYVSLDFKGEMPSGMTGVVGQTTFANFWLIGFGRDQAKKTNAAVEVRVLDSTGRPTLEKPIVMMLPKDTPENQPLEKFQFPIAMSREGNFMVEIKAADKTTNKTATLTFPIKVNPASK